ncbi:MAG TPA: glycine cleavage system aminomethyltransferase GcvT [Terrimicrobiaceae bacterium]
MKTPLYDRHVAAGGRMVDFAGWEMPVQYTSILDEHKTVRENCGIFDISHMGEFFVRGPKASEWLDSLLTNRVPALDVGEAHYSLMLNERGGVIDDLIVYRTGQQEFLLIVNAAKIDEDFAWLKAHSEPLSGQFLELSNCSKAYAALAVQGPHSPEVFSRVFSSGWENRKNRIVEFSDKSPVPAQGSRSEMSEPRVFVAITGYTGELGFEAIVPAGEAGHYWELFLAAGAKPCGLGARDTLRLEMCYPLNGSDLSPDHTPLEAGLGHFVDLGSGNFIGRDALLQQKTSGVPRRLSAIRVQEKSPPIRSHYQVFAAGKKVAETTSGALSPSLGCGIALAYLPFPLAKVGQDLEIEVRGRRYRAAVVKKPFYKPKS